MNASETSSELSHFGEEQPHQYYICLYCTDSLKQYYRCLFFADFIGEQTTSINHTRRLWLCFGYLGRIRVARLVHLSHIVPSAPSLSFTLLFFAMSDLLSLSFSASRPASQPVLGINRDGTSKPVNFSHTSEYDADLDICQLR